MVKEKTFEMIKLVQKVYIYICTSKALGFRLEFLELLKGRRVFMF